MLKAILFDFDGTLADTAPGIVRNMAQTFEEMGLPVPAEQDMKDTIGIPLVKALQMLGNLSDEDTQVAMDTYLRLYPTVEVSYVSIFPQVKETLQVLANQGIRMAIATSRGAESLELIMRNHGIEGFFETTITNDDHLTPKPAPDMVLHLLERMEVTADETIVVGDTTYDIRMGNGAGCKTVAVTYGNHPKEKLASAEPSYTIDEFGELMRIVDSLR